MRFVSGPCSETQPASASSDNGRGKGARALMEARGRYPVRRAAVPTKATGERREHERPLDEWPARTGTACSLRSLALDVTKTARLSFDHGHHPDHPQTQDRKSVVEGKGGDSGARRDSEMKKGES